MHVHVYVLDVHLHHIPETAFQMESDEVVGLGLREDMPESMVGGGVLFTGISGVVTGDWEDGTAITLEKVEIPRVWVEEGNNNWFVVPIVSDDWVVVTKSTVDVVAISDNDWVMVGIVDEGKIVGISNSLVVKDGWIELLWKSLLDVIDEVLRIWLDNSALVTNDNDDDGKSVIVNTEAVE